MAATLSEGAVLACHLTSFASAHSVICRFAVDSYAVNVQVYLDDLQTEQSWSDRDECRLFIENALTAFGSAAGDGADADEHSNNEPAPVAGFGFGTRLPPRAVLDAIATIAGEQPPPLSPAAHQLFKELRALSAAQGLYITVHEWIWNCN